MEKTTPLKKGNQLQHKALLMLHTTFWNGTQFSVRRSHEAPRHLLLTTWVPTKTVASTEFGELCGFQSRLLTCPGHAGSATWGATLCSPVFLASILVARLLRHHYVPGMGNAQSLAVFAFVSAHWGQRIAVGENKLLANWRMPLCNCNLRVMSNWISERCTLWDLDFYLNSAQILL